MDMKWLRTFELAAKLLNYRKVAEQLYITQPAVSLHIKQLEEELNCKLFVKKGRHIQLTESGRHFRMEALQLLTQYETTLQKMNTMRQGFTDSLKIGITPLLIESTFPSIIRKYTEKQPTIELAITVAESSELAGMLEKDQIDVAFSCLPSLDSSIICEELFHDTLTMVIAHDGLDLESAPPLDPVALFKEKLIFSHHHPSYWPSLIRNIQLNAPTARFLKVTQSHAAKRFILEGMGISFFPSFAVRRELMEGRLLEVHPPPFPLPVCSIYVSLKYEHSVESDLVQFTRRFYMS
ncbi:LysR family transcriptional regulator [Halobacillus salinarum]|uniref:LysR family transcriptional regulator n=1 Tax=Halobacillus salinarum TaxID=2932257 RepID=A0ABY4EH21_9BACI|nr:LysR family transcriptional regulator [Halobacillus salinarum]UOQ42929.1 LysR family transcriptional regulator [Halobacillus salinarum]